MLRLITALCSIALAACTTGTTPTGTDLMTAKQGTLFTGATVLAGPQQTPQRNLAIYVDGGLIRDIGPIDSMQTRYPAARMVESAGGTILPGLTDAHGHLYGLGLGIDTVDLTSTTSYAEIVERVQARAAQGGAGWIQGRGWDQNDWEVKEFPTSAALDAAISDRPVFLTRVDGHAIVVNSAAIRAAGVTSSTQDPAGGKILRDGSGKPTGVFIDAAMDLIEKAMPPASFEQKKARVLAAAQRIAASGLTEMHDAGADDETIRAVRELIDEKKFPIRVYIMLRDDAPLLQRWFKSGPLLNYGNKLTVRSVKLYADGALGSRGAALLHPYSDDTTNSGLMIARTEHVADVSKRALATGFQVNTHAIGDRGNRNVLDAYEQAAVTADKRFRIEHVQVISGEDVPRMVGRGVIASMQPTHATSDMYWAEKRLGQPRVRDAYAWRTILNAGGRLALGSDFPVEDVNPFFGIYAAVTRQDQKNWPEGGWAPEQRLTLAEAIRGFTLDAAYAAFEESTRGTIEVGKLADFTIVEGDLMTMPVSELWKAKVRATVVGGEVVHGK